MTAGKKLSIFNKKLFFYSISFVLAILGIYAAKIIQAQNKIVTGGIVGLALFYLLWVTYVLPKNTKSKFAEFEDLEFPRDMYYLLYGFVWAMIIYWAGSQFLDLVW